MSAERWNINLEKNAMKRWSILFFILVGIGGSLAYWFSQREPDWRAITIADVDAIHSILTDGHPGAVGPNNSEFQVRLAQAYDDAVSRAQSVEDATGHYNVKLMMMLAFADAHLADQLFEAPERTLRWPGIAVSYDDDGRLTVKHVETDEGPPLGAELISCDGKDINELAKTLIDTQVFNHWLPSTRRAFGHRILQDRDNPFVSIPNECAFNTDGATKTYQLKWRDQANDWERVSLSLYPPQYEQTTDFRILENGLVWVSVESFADSDPEVKIKIERLLAQLHANRNKIAAAPALVIDVRRNLGGATEPGLKIAGAIWGDGYIQDRQPKFDATLWRASELNIRQAESILQGVKQNLGTDSAIYQNISLIKKGMETSLASGNDFFVQEQSYPEATGDDPLTVPSSVFFLTDRHCVSACLDFADLMLNLPGVTHIGEETAGDTSYLEVSFAPLPSGLSQVAYPAAIHKGRVRGNNETYVPELVWSGAMSDDDALALWVASLAGIT